jgi:translation initiation factor 1
LRTIFTPARAAGDSFSGNLYYRYTGMDQLVYSTDGSHLKLCPDCGKNPCACVRTPAGRAPGAAIKMRLEKNGRGGKTVTVLFELPRDARQCEDITKKLKKLCGTGGTFKDDRVEIQGDHRDKVEGIVKGLGYKVVRAGG